MFPYSTFLPPFFSTKSYFIIPVKNLSFNHANLVASWSYVQGKLVNILVYLIGNTTKSMGKGIGMGLAISYQIINEKHLGKLKLNYLPGKGTEFKII